MISRRRGRWLAAVVCLLALVSGGALYQRSRAVDVRAHAELKELLQHLAQIDSDLGEGVLASRYGLVNQYDALTRTNADLSRPGPKWTASPS